MEVAPEGLAPEGVPEAVSGREVAGRVGTSIIDQALSAGTNFLVTLVAARYLSAEAFGAFGVTYLVAVTIFSSMRSTLGGPVLIFQDEAAEDHAARPLGAAVAVGVASGAVVAVVGLLLGGQLRTPFLALAASCPALLVQDMGRLLGFAELRPGKAVVLDLQWTVVLVVGLVGWGALVEPLTAATILAIWGAGAWVGAIWCLWGHGRRLPRPSLVWVRDKWEYAWRYFLTFASTLGVVQLTGVLLSVVSGVTAVGSVRAAQLLFAPVQNLAGGVGIALVPDSTSDVTSRSGRNRLILVSTLLSAIVVPMTLVALLVPDDIGEIFLGDSWEGARSLILPAGIAAGLLGVMTGPIIGLRAAKAAHESLVTGLQLSAVQLVVPTALAIAADESGYMWGLAGTSVVGAVLWWRAMSVIQRRGPRRLDSAPLP